MEQRSGRGRWVLTVVGLAVAMVLLVGILGRTLGPGSSTATPGAVRPAPGAGLAGVQGGDVLAVSIAKAQAHLVDVPGDWASWAELGAAYVQEVRLTADPSYYPKAQGALARSLAEHPQGNALALVGEASLAASRHDFAGALRLSRQSIALNAYGSAAYGIEGDALDELGRYPEATAAFGRMVDLQPGLSSFTRVSYSYELRGQTVPATYALQRALADASAKADVAYALYYLGEIAWNDGNSAQAAADYAQGLDRDPDYLPLLEARARVEEAAGNTRAAVRDLASVVQRLPQPAYVIELGELYQSLGRTADAQSTYQLVRDEEKIFQAQGVNVDLELSLFEADHGDRTAALRTASAEFHRRQSILVEDAYAWALHVNGRDAEALPHAVHALRLGTKSPLLEFHRGAIEAALGRRADAVRDLRLALTLQPHFSPLLAPRARALLSQLGAS